MIEGRPAFCYTSCMAGYSFSMGNPAQRAGNPLYGSPSPRGGGSQYPSGGGFFSGSSPQSFGQYDPYASSSRGGGGRESGQYASPLPPGGVYGQQKWMPGNGIDVFVRRGTPVYAPFDGVVGPNPMPIPSPVGPVPSFILRGNNGMSFQATHAQITAQGAVKQGQQIGVVNDPGMDILGPYQGMPDGFQHLDITMGHGSGPFPLQGGDINAGQWLGQIGYQGRQIPGSTRGPDGGGGGSFGGPGGFSPGSPMGNPFGGGGPSGMPGMPPGMGMGMSPGGPGGGMGIGIPGMSPGGPNPFMSLFSGGQPGNPFMGGGPGASPGGFSPPGFGMMSLMQPPQMRAPQMAPPMNLPSFGGFGSAPSPMALGMGNPFSFAGGGGPGGAAGMMMNPFGGPGPAGAASMYGNWGG